MGKFKTVVLSFKIKNLLLISLIYLGVSGRNQAQISNGRPELKSGADRPELYLPLLKNKKTGVVTNQTGIVLSTTKHEGNSGTQTDTLSIVDFLLENGINVKKVFAPEHGFRGEADAGEHVKNGVDHRTGLPIISLYGKNKKPTAEQMKDLDVIVFDIQDVGVRFYTYISTLAYVMEAAAENKVEVLVLDRPNPHDGYIDGPVLKKPWQSFVGLHPVPVVYGMTIGEYGKMINGEGWLKNKIKAKYTLIPMENYRKRRRYPLLKRPSPNLPNEQAIRLYPSLCFFEGTQVSVGRGTRWPFQVYGSPWTPSMPFTFTPQPSDGAKDPFLNGQLCYGENLTETTGDLKRLNLSWLLKAYQAYRHPKQNFFLSNLFFDKLAGTDKLRKQIIQGKTEKEIRESWQKELEAFQKIRRKYLHYED
ncbi:exo-beta-N-acetylmuramidase NamZ family protein [Bergeyella sp. RCAD1439]|uniref:exo-beta-N-acetylmuramidase NamZ family protein n=1 Tax=Bergeyella anatis TaxID=3113737 RepID=UPI002E17E93D|nr:DUF1343 domain-containing protein [Bergeyella sp. RCAD1439]